MKKAVALLLVLVFPLYLSCFNKEEKPDPMEMNRIIPPDNTIGIDFTTLQSNTKAYPELTPQEGLCLTTAWLLVAWSNLVCYTPFAVPIAIFKVLKTQIPTSVSPDRVEWTYTHTISGVEYTVSVVAEYNATYLGWEWSVSINDFVYLTGGSKDDLTSGYWQFYENLSGVSNATIGVEWIHTSDTDMSVTFSNNNVLNELKDDDYIKYTRFGNDINVQFYDEHRGTNDDGGVLNITVYWNIVNNTGGITPNVGNEGVETACTWDPNE